MAELTVDAKRENVQQVLDFVLSFLDLAGCGEDMKTEFSIAIDEVFVNIASYAYNYGEGKATVKCYANENPIEIKIEFIDEGLEFNPLEKEDPDFDLELEDMQIGGLGFFMVKEMMDTVSYKRENNKNIFTIAKKIRRHSGAV